MAVTVKAVALYDNEGEDQDELSFKCNDTLTIIKEEWQAGWHLCQLGEKRGLAPANYLQLVRLAPRQDDIYDCPRSKDSSPARSNTSLNKSQISPHASDLYINHRSPAVEDDEEETYVLPGRSNTSHAHDDDDEDIYENTFNLSNISLRSTNDLPSMAPAPLRPVPEPATSHINYPSVPPHEYKPPTIHPPLQSQFSEYLDMSNFPDELDYDEVPEQQDYDEVPSHSHSDLSLTGDDIYDVVPSSRSSSIQNSKESVRRSKESVKQSKESLCSSHDEVFGKSTDSLHSAASRNSRPPSGSFVCPPGAPNVPPKLSRSPYQPSQFGGPFEEVEYMSPVRNGNHEANPYNSPKTSPYNSASPYNTAKDSSPYNSASPYSAVKKIPKGKGTLKTQIPNIFSTLRRNAKGSPVPAPSTEEVTPYHNRPLPSVPAPELIDYNRNRPLPPPPSAEDDHEQQDYDEIDECADYAEVPNSPEFNRSPPPPPPGHPPPPPPVGRPPAAPSPRTPYQLKHELQRQRSKSVTTGTAPLLPPDNSEERRHSSPDRPDLFQDKKAEHHDYFELPEDQPEPAASRTVSVYSPTTLSKLPFRNPIPNHPNPRPDNRADPLRAVPPPPPPPISRISPPESEAPLEPPSLEAMFSSCLLTSHDMALIDEQSLSPLIVNITTPLIKFTQCSNSPRDVKEADAYVEFCKATATACIAMVGHLHSLTQTLEHQALKHHLQTIRQRLYDDTKQMIQATKTARLQYPALVAQNEMVMRRNELISTIREVKVCFKTVIDLNTPQ